MHAWYAAIVNKIECISHELSCRTCFLPVHTTVNKLKS